MSDQPFQQDGRWYQRQMGADGAEFLQPVPDPAAPPLPSVVEVNPRRRARSEAPGTGTGRGVGAGDRDGLQLAADGDAEDLVTPFLANRAQAERARSLQQLDQWAAGVAEPGAPAAAEGGGPPASAPAAAGATDRAPVLGAVMDAAGATLRTAGDMATQAFVSAPLGALRNVFVAADDIANWVTGQEPPPEGEAGFAGNPGRAVADLLPQGPDPTSTAGRVTRDIAQFLFGFVGGARAVRGVRGALAGGARAAAPRTAAGAAAEGMTAGAIADFFAQDSNRTRLSDIWQEAGLPANALTDFLASDDDDGEAEARLKSTIEGSLMGAAAEGLFLAARGFRAWRRARSSSAVASEETAQQAAREAAEQQDGEMVRAANRLLNGRDLDLGVPDHVAARGLSEAAPARPISEPPALMPEALRARGAGENPEFFIRSADGQRFLRGPTGTADLGMVPAIRDQAAAPIRLRRQTLDHVDNPLHRENAQEFGFRDGLHLTLDVASHWEQLITNPARDNVLLVRALPESDRQAIAVVELSRAADGAYWQIRSSGIRRPDQLEGYVPIPVRERTPNQAAGPSAPLRSPDEAGGTESFAQGGDRNPNVAPAAPEFQYIENTREMRASGEPGPVFINFARISTAEDVQRALQETADAFRGEVNAAGRNVQTNEETRELAARLGLTPAQLLDRRTGEAWNAETIHAAREMLNSSTERLLELARVAAGPNASPAEGYAFRRMLATHAAIQAEVLGARREAGRALQAWGMAAGSNREQVAMINDLLEQTGGVSTAQAMAQRLLASADDPTAMATIARAGWGVRTLDAVREAWVNALLSSPGTHLANMTSNTLSMASAVIERSAAARLGTTVEQGEAAEMLRGMIGATMDAFRLAARAYRDGSGDMGRLMTSKVDRPNSRAISSEAAGIDPGSTLGRAVDFMGHSIVSAPSRTIQAEDAFFQTFFYRAELRAQALRMARQAEDAIGALERGSPQYDAAVTGRMQELVDNPPEQLRLAAADSALYYTLNRATWGTAAGGGADAPGQISRGLQQLRDRVQLFGFIMPFLRTPMNAFSFGAERSPLAPLVGQWRADLAAGGARADLAMARMSVGTAAMLVAFDFADRGLVTGNGPDDPGERENWANLGITPYSIRVGDAWVQYNRLDPLGFLFSFSANMAEMVRRRETELTEVDQPGEIISAALSAIALPMLNRSSMQGLGGIFDAVSRSEMSAANFANQFAGSFVPGVVAATERAMDPAGSQVMTPFDAIQARIPGLSASLPPRRNRWGEVVVPEDPAVVLANAFGPARVSRERTSPIDSEMERLNLNVTRMPLQQDFGAALGGGSAPVQLNSFPEVYDRLVVLAGNEWRDPGTNLGLRDRLDAMVEGRGQDGGIYRLLTDGRQGGKAQMILAIVEQHRLGARLALLQDPAFAEFREFVLARRQETMEQRAPLAR